MQLGANRPTISLSDCHGQIWAQLALAHKNDPSLFPTDRSQVKNRDSLIESIKEYACLGSDPDFPLRKLVTLWRNNAWHEMITSWCNTELGRCELKISMWSELAGYRLDNVSHYCFLPCSRNTNLSCNINSTSLSLLGSLSVQLDNSPQIPLNVSGSQGGLSLQKLSEKSIQLLMLTNCSSAWTIALQITLRTLPLGAVRSDSQDFCGRQAIKSTVRSSEQSSRIYKHSASLT